MLRRGTCVGNLHYYGDLENKQNTMERDKQIRFSYCAIP